MATKPQRIDTPNGWICIHCADSYRIPIVMRRVRQGALCARCHRPGTVFKTEG